MSESQTKNSSDSDNVVSGRIHRHAVAYAEAQTYSLNNNYLTKAQKAQVEAVCQFPIGLFGYLLLGHLAFAEPQSYLTAFIFAAACSAVVAIPWWYMANTTIAKAGFLFAGGVTTVIELGFAVYLGYHGYWPAVGIAVASALGLLVMIAPSMWIYSLLSRNMNPKYRIAKKLFGVNFPFEKDLN